MYELLQELYVLCSKSCKRQTILCKQLETVADVMKLWNLSKTAGLIKVNPSKVFGDPLMQLTLIFKNEKMDEATRKLVHCIRSC